MASASEIPPEFHPQVVALNQPTNGSFALVWIGCIDLNRAQRFYAATFGWNFLTSPRTTKKTAPTGSGPRIFMTGGEVMGALNLVAPSAADMLASCGPGGIAECRVPPRILNFIKVRDVDATLAKVVQAGGRVNRDKWLEEGQGEYALMEDPEGNVLGLMKRIRFGEY